MSGYLVKYIAGNSGQIGVYRPNERFPAFMVQTVDEAFDMIKIDRSLPEPLIRCVGCVEAECPCVPLATER